MPAKMPMRGSDQLRHLKCPPLACWTSSRLAVHYRFSDFLTCHLLWGELLVMQLSLSHFWSLSKPPFILLEAISTHWLIRVAFGDIFTLVCHWFLICSRTVSCSKHDPRLFVSTLSRWIFLSLLGVLFVRAAFTSDPSFLLLLPHGGQRLSLYKTHQIRPLPWILQRTRKQHPW